MSPTALGQGNLGQQQLGRQTGWTMFVKGEAVGSCPLPRDLGSPNFTWFEPHDRWTRRSLSQQGWAWLRAGRISVKQALTWRRRRQEKAGRDEKVQQEGQGTQSRVATSIIFRDQPTCSTSGRRISHLEQGWTQDRLCSSGGRTPGYSKSIDRQEKGEELLLTWRCRGKMNLGQGRSIKWDGKRGEPSDFILLDRGGDRETKEKLLIEH